MLNFVLVYSSTECVLPKSFLGNSELTFRIDFKIGFQNVAKLLIKLITNALEQVQPQIILTFLLKTFYRLHF